MVWVVAGARARGSSGGARGRLLTSALTEGHGSRLWRWTQQLVVGALGTGFEPALLP